MLVNFYTKPAILDSGVSRNQYIYTVDGVVCWCRCVYSSVSELEERGTFFHLVITKQESRNSILRTAKKIILLHRIARASCATTLDPLLLEQCIGRALPPLLSYRIGI